LLDLRRYRHHADHANISVETSKAIRKEMTFSWRSVVGNEMEICIKCRDVAILGFSVSACDGGWKSCRVW